MPKNYSHNKKTESMVAQSLRSGIDFVEMKHEAVAVSLIKPTATERRRFMARMSSTSLKEVELKYLENCTTYTSKKPTVEVLSNSSVTATKIHLVLDGDHLNPLQQAKDASANVVVFRNIASDMEGLFKMAKDPSFKGTLYDFEGERPHAYAGVVSLPNSTVGSLDSDVKALNKFTATLYTKLKDAHRRNGITGRLLAEDGTYAAPVGMLTSNEMTFNPKKLESLNGNGIFHPHIHFVLFVDKKLDATVKTDLYDIWDNVTGNYKTDIQAFSFDDVYSKDDKNKKSDSEDAPDIAKCLKEVTKYLMDPSKLNILRFHEDDTPEMREFKTDLFAEYYNTYHGLKRTRTYGLLLDATSFVSRFESFKNASVYSNAELIPEIMTRLNEMVYDDKSKRYMFNSVRVLSDSELLHENRTFLSDVLVDSGYKDELNAFIDKVLVDLTTDKDRLFAMYFREKQFNSTLDELFAKLDEEFNEINKDSFKMGTDVFNRRQFKKMYGEYFELGNYDHFDKYRSMVNIKSGNKDAIYSAINLFGRACDLVLLKDALENLVDFSGKTATYSRTDIDTRIFARRKAYRDSLGQGSKRDVAFNFEYHNLFYKFNGMQLPVDGRTSEVLSLFVDEIDEDAMFDLFRVPQGARDKYKQHAPIITINGVAA